MARGVEVVPYHQAEDAVRTLLRFMGEDPDREGLKETPQRVLRSYNELFAGYRQDPAAVMKVFEDGTCDEVVLLRNVSFTSLCEHHMLPFTGQAHVAYLPDKKILGLSKLARLVDIFARRLQVQERLTQQVVQALMEHLQPKGAACVVQAIHSCLACRGAGKPGAEMVTSCLLGAFRDEPAARAELLQLIYAQIH